MRTRMITLALIAAIGGAASIAIAGPTDQKQPDTAAAPDSTSSDATAPEDGDDVHITVRAGRGRLGFAALQISSELRKFLGAPADRGVLVDRIRPGSPAERAGLRVGDVLTAVDGTSCQSASDVIEAIADRKKGEVVTLEVVRGKARVQLHAKLEDDPDTSWRSFRAFDEHFWDRFKADSPFDLGPLFGDKDLRQSMEALRKQLEKLEQRMNKVDGKRT
jgi:membrane-associated protease RseP (regulator of RpoE activity)